MTTFTAPAVDWAALSPVLIVLLAAVVGVLVEAFVPARVRRTWAGTKASTSTPTTAASSTMMTGLRAAQSTCGATNSVTGRSLRL